MKLVIVIFFLFFVEFAQSTTVSNFSKQHPTVCEENLTYLETSKNSLVAVLKCLDNKDKEIFSCKLQNGCDKWFYDIYLKVDGKYEQIQKTNPLSGYDSSIQVKKNTISRFIKFHFGSTTRSEFKYQLRGKKLKLIGFEYSISFNGNSIGPGLPHSSDFSVNTLSEKMIQTDYDEDNKESKTTCKVTKFKNLTIADDVDTSISNLVCDNK